MKWSNLQDTVIKNTNPNTTEGSLTIKAWVSDCGLFAVHRAIDGYDDEFYVTHLPTGCKCSQWFETAAQAKKYASKIKPLADWTCIELKKRRKYDGKAHMKDKKLSLILRDKCIEIRNEIMGVA